MHMSPYGRIQEKQGREEETMKKKGTLYLVQMALLIAIIILMAFTPIGYITVSYTHLDVYKRQILFLWNDTATWAEMPPAVM